MTVCANDGVYSKPPAISCASTVFHALTYSKLRYINVASRILDKIASGTIYLWPIFLDSFC